MHYFAQQDPQGSRLLFILTSFRDVVLREQAARDQQTLIEQQAQAPTFTQLSMISVSGANDPMGNLFQGSSRYAPKSSPVSSAADPVASRHDSTASIGPSNVTTPTALPRKSSNPNEALSPTGNGPDTMAFRHHSLDAFFDLARVSSHPNSAGSVHDSDSLGDAEIDFETLWQWPNSNGLTGLTPGLGPGIGLTPAVGMGSQYPVPVSAGSGIDVQGISDSSVPLFGMTSGEYGGT